MIIFLTDALLSFEGCTSSVVLSRSNPKSSIVTHILCNTQTATGAPTMKYRLILSNPFSLRNRDFNRPKVSSIIILVEECLWLNLFWRSYRQPLSLYGTTSHFKLGYAESPSKYWFPIFNTPEVTFLYKVDFFKTRASCNDLSSPQ